MKTKVSKAQEEVWEWKERAFQKLEHVPKEQRVKHIVVKTQQTIDRIKKKKSKII